MGSSEEWPDIKAGITVFLVLCSLFTFIFYLLPC